MNLYMQLICIGIDNCTHNNQRGSETQKAKKTVAVFKKKKHAKIRKKTALNVRYQMSLY